MVKALKKKKKLNNLLIMNAKLLLQDIDTALLKGKCSYFIFEHRWQSLDYNGENNIRKKWRVFLSMAEACHRILMGNETRSGLVVLQEKLNGPLLEAHFHSASAA